MPPVHSTLRSSKRTLEYLERKQRKELKALTHPPPILFYGEVKRDPEDDDAPSVVDFPISLAPEPNANQVGRRDLGSKKVYLFWNR
jgi:hypothetical protein